ncbi:MAG: DUF2934 domain-containing protein [Bryobacteraceae bacterium]
MKQTVRNATKSCDQLTLPGAAGPKRQQRIATRAYRLWLARGFRNGSPQEDWLRAQREVAMAPR